MTPQTRDVRRRELGGQDPIDRRLGAPPPSPLTWLLSLLRTRSALGFAPSLTPAVIFLPLGALLGPQALGVIPPGLLRGLDLAVSLALAVLGVLVGTALGREIESATRLFIAASLESLVTIAAVAAATVYFVHMTEMPIDAPVAALAIALGLCASASSATSADPDSEPVAEVATRVADLDDVLPIVLGMGAFLLLSNPDEHNPWAYVAAPVLIGVTVGFIGWLLFERAESGAERAVYVLGALALAGGAASYLGVSPLGVGLVAGLTWTVAPGARRSDRADGPAEGSASRRRSAARHGRRDDGAVDCRAVAAHALPAVPAVGQGGRRVAVVRGSSTSAPPTSRPISCRRACWRWRFALNFRQMLPAVGG